MKTDTHGSTHGLCDLYILPDDAQEAAKIIAWLESREIGHSWQFSDTKGQDWHGKRFIEIPFGEGYADVIRQAMVLPIPATN